MSQRSRKILAALMMMVLLAYGVFLAEQRVRNPGGADSSGYLNAARALAMGAVVMPIVAVDELGLPEHPLAFIPLGYSLGPREGTMVPYYPPGLPVHFALAGELLGWKRGPYLVSPLAAMLLALAIYLTGREMQLRRRWSFISAAIVAAFPTLLFQATQPMSDVVASLWVTLVILFALKARADDRWALLAGLAAGIAVAVRPSNALILPALAVALPISRRTLLLCAAGASLPAAGLGWWNAAAFGSPLATGYSRDLAGRDLALQHFVPRFVHYLEWLVILMGPVPLLAWAALPRVRSVAFRARLLLFVWFGAFFLFYCFYRHYDAWWYTRFLLPALPAIALAAGFALQHFVGARGESPGRSPRALLVVLAVASIFSAELWNAHARTVFSFRASERVYQVAAATAPMRFPLEKPYVLSMQLSGVMAYYGTMRPVRWDWIDVNNRNEILEPILERQPLYALLFDWEIQDAQRRVPGAWEKLDRYGDVTLWRIDPRL